MKDSKITRAVRTDDGRVLIEQPDGSYRQAESLTGWDQLERMTQEEIEEAALSDADAPPMTCDDKWWKQRLGSCLKIKRAPTCLDWAGSATELPDDRSRLWERQSKESLCRR